MLARQPRASSRPTSSERTDRATALRQFLYAGAEEYVLELLAAGRISSGKAAELPDTTVLEADLVEVGGGVWDLEPPEDGLEEAPLARRIGHAAPVLEVDHVRLDLAGIYVCMGYIDGILTADPFRDPALEEPELLLAVVDGPLATPAGALGRQEKVDRLPEPEPLARLRLDRWPVSSLAYLNVRHRSHPPSRRPYVW